MNSRKLLLSFVGLATGLILQVQALAATIGQPAPVFSLNDLGGQPFQLQAQKGKIVVLEWTNPECPFVRRHYESGNIPALQKEAVCGGVVWVTINSAAEGQQGDYEPARAGTWLSEHGASPVVYLRDRDGTVGRLYGAETTPHLFVIDAEGTLVYQGAIDDNRRTHVGAHNYVRAALEAVRAGKPVEKASTQSYGCAVKY